MWGWGDEIRWDEGRTMLYCSTWCTAGPVCAAQSKMPSVSVCDAVLPVYTTDLRTAFPFMRRHAPVRENYRWVARGERDALKVITTRGIVIINRDYVMLQGEPLVSTLLFLLCFVWKTALYSLIEYDFQ